MIGFSIGGMKEVRKGLKQLTGPEMKRAINASLRKTFRPALKRAKAHTPVRTGALRASLGFKTSNDRQRGTMTIAIISRLRFSVTNKEGKSAKFEAGMKRWSSNIIAGKRSVRGRHPRSYIGRIEAREHMLERAMTSTDADVQRIFKEDIRKQIEKQLAKRKAKK